MRGSRRELEWEWELKLEKKVEVGVGVEVGEKVEVEASDLNAKRGRAGIDWLEGTCVISTWSNSIHLHIEIETKRSWGDSAMISSEAGLPAVPNRSSSYNPGSNLLTSSQLQMWARSPPCTCRAACSSHSRHRTFHTQNRSHIETLARTIVPAIALSSPDKRTASPDQTGL
ncbi:hypothetical protein Taro_027788 [Colocasia esculenta]|uniref:Uncharacterized protein n=1 Tax=Colocasia esculenta TaxID=4460 RepID=A0A843VPU5_COLES|nr:hypothetical protein [Colocasia esculenta]